MARMKDLLIQQTGELERVAEKLGTSAKQYHDMTLTPEELSDQVLDITIELLDLVAKVREMR